MRRIIILLSVILLQRVALAQPSTDKFLLDILKGSSSPVLKKVIDSPQLYRCQIVYTQINRDRNNVPSFHSFHFNVDPTLYFNPASMVKMPLAFMALEKLNTLKVRGVDKYTTIVFDSSFKGQKAMSDDNTAAGGLPSIAHLVRRAFLISENDPYNRLYQFVGQQNINRNFLKKGYERSLITRQFMGFTPEQNRHTNAIRFLDKDGRLLYSQPAAYNTDSIHFREVIKIGRAHWDRNDSLIQGPFDFTMHNNLPLDDLRQMLQSVMFPSSVKKRQRFNLKDDDYEFLYRYLSQYPSETPWPKYDEKKFHDSYVKFFFSDSTHKMPEELRVFNKVGWAYGFVTDVSYVADFKNKVEFMLAATIYVNSDGVVNDSKYDYETIGSPFMHALGQTIYQYELKRYRPFPPDLSRFRIKYENRDPKDERPVLKEVDN